MLSCLFYTGGVIFHGYSGCGDQSLPTFLGLDPPVRGAAGIFAKVFPGRTNDPSVWVAPFYVG